jgi:hypothetical protein
MSESSIPISKELGEAFAWAIGEFERWRPGEPEPTVTMNMQAYPISTICTLVGCFDERMPDHLWNQLAMARGHIALPVDRSYGSAARHLGRLIYDR